MTGKPLYGHEKYAWEKVDKFRYYDANGVERSNI